MKHESRANTLLIELLLVILCFMIASVTLVEMFANAKQKSTLAKATSDAALETQNIAETLYATEDPEKEIAELGFEKGEEGWTLERDDYSLLITDGSEETGAGTIRALTVTALRDGEKLVEIPSTRYLPGEAEP